MLTEAPIQPSALDDLPAGGSDPTQFDCREAWYPIHYVRDLDRTRPTRFTLLERDLVIWWDRQANHWRVFDDQCPHRLVPLSEGRIAEDGLLECPYHGWAFNGEGQCDRIPQQVAGGAAHQSPRACVASLPAVEKQGLLFVYAGEPENATRVKVPVIEPMAEDSQDWICLDTFRDLPYDALTLLENVLDSSHVPFTHHRTIGKRSNAAPVELEVVESGKQGFQGVWAEGPRKGTLGRQDTRFIAPNLMWHDLTSKQFGRTLTVVYATPIRKGECRLFARFPFKFAAKLPAFLIQLTPRWYSHISQNRILEDDQIFLYYQERTLAAKGGSADFARSCYLPTRSDYFVSALHQWINRYQADPFPNQPLPPLQPTDVILERYHSHTEKCASCRRALVNVRRIKMGLAIAGAIAWILLPLLILGLGQPPLWLAAGLTALALLAGTGWLWLHQLEQQFSKGQEIPPRNLPEKKQ